MKNLNKLQSLLLILFIYIITFFIVYIIFPFLPGENISLKILYADVLATVMIFVVSYSFNNSSVYDPYWSVAPPLIAGYLFLMNPGGNVFRQMTVLALVFLWAIRLTLNWARGWRGIKHQDWRYAALQQQNGKFYWPVSFLGIHLMPTVLVYLGCLPLFYVMSDPSPLGYSGWIAVLVTLSATLIEWAADEQLRLFRKNNPPGSVMKSGLWSLMRHPNYFGEIGFWFGIYLFVLSGNTDGSSWTGIGFLSMVMLFTFVSVPMMDRHNQEKRPDYEEYKKTRRALVPFLKGRGG